MSAPKLTLRSTGMRDPITRTEAQALMEREMERDLQMALAMKTVFDGVLERLTAPAPKKTER